MQSHDDVEHIAKTMPEFAERMERLRKRAERMTLDQENEITAGRDGEEVLLDTRSRGFAIQQLPEDRDGVLRIPTAALLEGGRVLVPNGGRLEERSVDVGLRNWEFAEVRGGLTTSLGRVTT